MMSQRFTHGRLLAAAAIAILAGTQALSLAAVRPGPTAPHAMVVAADPDAARAALDVLRAGGNAVDAAITTAFALAVTYPQAGNLGGGGYLLARMADGRSFVVDYRETAPAAATRDMFLDASGKVVADRSVRGALAAGVPGTVAGMAMAREIAGTMPLARLLAPAIALAEEGFAVRPGLARALEGDKASLASRPSTAAVFYPKGEPLAAGSLLVQKDLARTLRRIAEGGPTAFYEGPTAEAIVSYMKANGGLMTPADLASYRAIRREPLAGSYRGLDLLTVPPSSSGGVVLLEMLHMLEPRDLPALGRDSSAYAHLLAEVMKRAYADRASFLGDPGFVKMPLAGLLSRGYATQRMSAFDPERATASTALGAGDPSRFEPASTTHFTIADAAGNVVSNTYTINEWFGNGDVVDGAGFFLNNEMDDFSASPGTPNLYGLVGGEANAIAPGKRMLSSMTPVILTKEGRPLLTLGTPGGSRIPTTVLEVILGVVDYGMELQAAVDAPRCHHQWLPDRVLCEEGALSADVAAAMRRRGHEVKIGGWWGDVQAIYFDRSKGVLRGASDARGYGEALGY
jgi:gamma-glutamyltranspeptidase/glutathione hydrolase